MQLQDSAPAPSPLTWTYTVGQRTPVVFPDACPANVCQSLIEHWRGARAAAEAPLPRLIAGSAEVVLPPEWFMPSVCSGLSAVAEHFGLPFSPSSAEAVIGRYGPGTGTDWHMDATTAPGSADRQTHRTISFSMPLNDDFTGADLQFHDSSVAQEAGTLVGFTARTWHRVTPLETGERFAVIAFGGFQAGSRGT